MVFGKQLNFVLALAILLVSPVLPGPMSGAAHADLIDSEVLYSRKAWQVSVLGYDDGLIVCRAAVGTQYKSFSIWGYSDDRVKIQFYDSSWQFNNESADVSARIDSRGKWTLNDALLDQNSVWLDLPDEDASLRFVKEVMRGNTLNLYGSNGGLIERYSLAGSNASILKLIECVDALQSVDTDGNPFN